MTDSDESLASLALLYNTVSYCTHSPREVQHDRAVGVCGAAVGACTLAVPRGPAHHKFAGG